MALLPTHSLILPIYRDHLDVGYAQLRRERVWRPLLKDTVIYSGLCVDAAVEFGQKFKELSAEIRDGLKHTAYGYNEFVGFTLYNRKESTTRVYYGFIFVINNLI